MIWRTIWSQTAFWNVRIKGFFLLLVLFSSGCRGNEEIPISSSEEVLKESKETITIEISESVKNYRTDSDNHKELVIQPTKLITKDSHTELVRKTKRHLEDIENNHIDPTYENVKIDSKNRLDNADYDFIKPTQTHLKSNVAITATALSGEEVGVPTASSGPQKLNFDRESRYHNVQNKIETLENLAKISVNENSSREGRDEENRKANPDIQDIITGIVKILHGKANSSGNEGRPKPQSTRINNRGPPRISEVTPVNTDKTPAYLPIGPNRIPPPYPFDLPPALPPQPHKPGHNTKHPFLSGIPVPELIVPSSSEAFNSSQSLVKEDEDKKLFNKTKVSAIGMKTITKRPRPRPTPTKIIGEVKPTVATEPATDIFLESSNKTNLTSPPYKVIIPSNITSTTTASTSSTFSSVIVKTTTHQLPEKPIGIGEAIPILESSIMASTSISTTEAEIHQPTPSLISQTSTEFKARPGIVLDDPEFKPGGHKRPTLPQKPIITAPPAGALGEVFDVTVLAVQGPEGSFAKPVIVPVNIDKGQLSGDVSVITKPEEGQDFVSIDGKRTYINLFGESTQKPIHPTMPYTSAITATPSYSKESMHTAIPQQPPRRVYKKPLHPPVRIDTCIVGDDSTCDAAQNEMCRTEDGISSCHCRPGYNRRKHRDPCRRVISMVTSLRVDRLYDRKIVWKDSYKDPESEDYQELTFEAIQAIGSAMSMTPFSDDYMNSKVNSIYSGKNAETNEPAVFVNMTLQLEENLDTLRPAVRHDIKRHLLQVIHRRNNNVGNSAVWVDSPPGSVSALQDIDECSTREWHDCHQRAVCQNTFGSFKCQCEAGFRDPWLGNVHREGRLCESCGNEYCNNRGECRYERGQQVCICNGSFYGAQCEVDGEVLGVAIGASVAAAIIIILTLVCLCMWSRRWSREQKTAVGVGMGSPVFGFMGVGPTVKTPSVGVPPYQATLEERVRWAQLADAMAHANHYAQPEPGTATNRPSFSNYPTLPTHSMAGTLPLPSIAPPVPLPRLNVPKGPQSLYGGISQRGSIHQSTHGLRASFETTSSSEEEDRADLLGRNFNMPRPKSRASVANQSGIYYDVDLERSEMYAKHSIPMSTYTSNTRPFFR